MLQLHDEFEGVLNVAAGKVIVRDEKGKEGIGIVIDESENKKLIVTLESGNDIVISKPEYGEDGNFVYHNDDDKFKLVEFDPVRIKISSAGSFQIFFNKFILNDNNNKIIYVN